MGPLRVLRYVEAKFQAQGRVPNCPRHINAVARRDARAQDHFLRRDGAESGDRDDERPWTLHGVAAQERTFIGRGILAEPLRETREPMRRPIFRQGKPEKKTGRLRAFGGKIGEVHPQGLACDRSRRIVRKEVHSGDRHILGRDDIMARFSGENRGIVAQAKGPRPRERREVGRDQFVFGRTRHRFAFYPRGSNSAARHWRARASSTALIIPASSGPKKAPPISTYSLIETRAGTSARSFNS